MTPALVWGVLYRMPSEGSGALLWASRGMVAKIPWLLEVSNQQKRSRAFWSACSTWGELSLLKPLLKAEEGLRCTVWAATPTLEGVMLPGV